MECLGEAKGRDKIAKKVARRRNFSEHPRITKL
jgi:hypothetical protein